MNKGVPERATSSKKRKGMSGSYFWVNCPSASTGYSVAHTNEGGSSRSGLKRKMTVNFDAPCTSV